MVKKSDGGWRRSLNGWSVSCWMYGRVVGCIDDVLTLLYKLCRSMKICSGCSEVWKW